MKFNPDCIRDILLYLENNLKYENAAFSLKHKEISAYKIAEYLSSFYTQDDILYNIEKLEEENYIHYSSVSYDKNHSIVEAYIDDITFQGHEFLNNVRSKDIWETAKSGAKKIGSMSLKLLSTIAVQVITKKATNPAFIDKLVNGISNSIN